MDYYPQKQKSAIELAVLTVQVFGVALVAGCIVAAGWWIVELLKPWFS